MRFTIPSKLKPPKEFTDLADEIANTYDAVMNQRELICYAFMAETGCVPSEIEQVQRSNIDGSISWYVRKRGI